MDNRKFGKLVKKSLLVKAMKLSCKEQSKFMKGQSIPCGGRKRRK